MKTLKEGLPSYLIVLSIAFIMAFSITGFAKNPDVRVLAVSGPETEFLKSKVSNFEESMGLAVTIDAVSRDMWRQRQVRELIENQGTYDVVMIGGGDDVAWVQEKGNWQPLGKFLSEETIASVHLIDTFSKDGKAFAAPQYYNFPMLFYRKDLLNDPEEKAEFKKKYGRELTVPDTFHELYEVAQFFHRPPEMYGFFIGGTEWSIVLDHTYFLYGMNENYGDWETAELTLNTYRQKRAMEALTRMLRFNPPGAETMSFFDGDELMQEGKIFMYQNWFYIWSTFQEKMPDKIGTAPPVGDVQPGAHLGAFAATIPASAPNPQKAAEFIKWMISDEYQIKQTQATGNLPVRSDLLDDPEIKKAIPEYEKFAETVPHLTTKAVIWSSELSSGIYEAIQKVKSGEMSAFEVCEWLQNTKFKDRKAL